MSSNYLDLLTEDQYKKLSEIVELRRRELHDQIHQKGGAQMRAGMTKSALLRECLALQEENEALKVKLEMFEATKQESPKVASSQIGTEKPQEKPAPAIQSKPKPIVITKK